MLQRTTLAPGSMGPVFDTGETVRHKNSHWIAVWSNIMQVDTIDLYYAHKPDEHGVPLEETIGAFASLIEQGKILHWAVSNFDTEQLVDVLNVCDRRGWPRPVMIQPRYSLLDREAESLLIPLAEAEGIAVCP